MVNILIGVIGSGDGAPALDKAAEEVGSLIAGKGLILVNGGLGGVMLASARGAKKRGGTTVGLLPGADPREANPFIDIPIATGLGEMRNLLIVKAASALIAIGGGYGTLSELALGLKTGKPVVLLKVQGFEAWEVSRDLIAVSTPEEAVEVAVKAATSDRG